MNRLQKFFNVQALKGDWPLMGLWALFLLECVYIVFFLLNYDMAFMGKENFATHAWSLQNGKEWRTEDFARALNIDVLEIDQYRISRPISNFVELFNAKFRAWSWNFIPPHPSLSIVWPLFLVGIPILLFRAFRNFGCQRIVALAGMALYVGSIGFLLSVVMLFHPSKGLVNFFAALSLFLGSKMYKKVLGFSRQCSVREIPQFWPYFLGMLASIFLGFFCDETGLFIYPMMMVILAMAFWRIKEWPYLLGIYFVLPLAYFGAVHYVLPYIHYLVRGHWIDLLQYGSFPHLSDITWQNLYTNAVWLLSDHPHVQLNAKVLWDNQPWLLVVQVLYTLAVCSIFISCVVTLFKEHSRLRLLQVGAGLVLIVVFILFHTFQLSNNAKVWGVWWYGSLFSLIYFIAFTFIMQFGVERHKDSRIRAILVGCILIFIVQGLLNATYRLDIFISKQEHPAYSIEEIFNGRIGQYYKDFNFINSIERSRCRKVYITMMWAKMKQKNVTYTENQINACKDALAKDKYFLQQSEYLGIEL